MKILAITQARIGSTRLPGKILKTINGQSLLEIHIKRILKSKLISKLKIATTDEKDAVLIEEIAVQLGVGVYKGSINNVLDRFYKTAVTEKPDWVVRLTSDCPLIDANIIDKVIQFAVGKDLDYASNVLEPTFPDGMDVEVFKFTALKQAFEQAKLDSELEHVTPYIWKNSTFKGGSLFKSDCLINDTDYSDYRLTVDTIEDFQLIEKVIHNLGTDRTWKDYVAFLDGNLEVKNLNKLNVRNEGYQSSVNNDK